MIYPALHWMMSTMRYAYWPMAFQRVLSCETNLTLESPSVPTRIFMSNFSLAAKSCWNCFQLTGSTVESDFLNNVPKRLAIWTWFPPTMPQERRAYLIACSESSAVLHCNPFRALFDAHELTKHQGAANRIFKSCCASTTPNRAVESSPNTHSAPSLEHGSDYMHRTQSDKRAHYSLEILSRT